MKFVCIFTLLIALAAVDAVRSTERTCTAPLTVRTTLVMVPVLVTTKTGKVVFELTARRFPGHG